MDDFSIDLGDAAAFAETLPSLYRPFVQMALEADQVSVVEEAGLSLTGERRQSGIILNLGSGSSLPTNSLWSKVLDEIYDFLCTKSKEYRAERMQGATHFQALVHVVATAVGSTVSVGIAMLSGLVSIGLILVAKVGKNAWCKQYKA